MLQELLVNEEYLPQLYPYEERPLLTGEVRVKVDFGAPKHGTELNVFHNRPYENIYYDDNAHIFREKSSTDSVVSLGLGNFWVGRIIELDDAVEGYSIGERVGGYGHLRSTQTMDAGRIMKMPPGMDWQAAMCYDPMQFALGGIRDSHMRLGDKVLVSGLGAIGMMAAQAARNAGASFVAVADPIALRREVALENGADIAFNPIEEDFGLKLRDLTDQRGVDVIIETSANYKALEQCLRALAYNGNMALVGWYKKASALLDLGREGHFNQQNLFFSRACSEPNRDYPRWDFNRICEASWELLEKGEISCKNVIQPVVEFSECDNAYRYYVMEHPEESIKLGIKFT